MMKSIVHAAVLGPKYFGHRGGCCGMHQHMLNSQTWDPNFLGIEEAAVDSLIERLFLFLYFSKTFFTEIYFQYHNLQFCTPTARQGGGRGPAAQQRGGRDLYVNLKKKLFAREPLAGACRPPGGRQPPCRQPTGRQGACRPPGGRQAPLLWTPCCVH